MSQTINVLSLKGGCGKSETVLNLAYGLAKKGQKILVVDCDPQCNTTSILLSEAPLKESEAHVYLDIFNKTEQANDFLKAISALKSYVEMQRTRYDLHHVLEQRCKASEAIISTRYENIDILPSGAELTLTDFQLKSLAFEPYKALRKALLEVNQNYDVILIDNQPFKNALTFNTIASCIHEKDLIIIPTKLNRGGLEGTNETILTTLEWLQTERLPLDVKILGTMVNRNSIDRTWVDALQQTFKNQMFKTTIRYQAKPVEDASMKKKILLETTNTGVAQDYLDLVDEVFECIH